MAVAHTGTDSSSVSTGSGASTLTFSHTVPSGADCLIVQPEVHHYATPLSDISGVTFNGVSMTAITGASGACTTPPNTKIGSYVLVAPAIGTYDVVVTYSSTTNFGQGACASSYSGVDQTTPTEGGDFQQEATQANDVAIPTTTTVNGDYIIGLLAKADRPVTSVACDDTQIAEWPDSNADTVFNAGYTASSGSGNELNWTTDVSSRAGCWAAFALKAAGAAATAGGSFKRKYVRTRQPQTPVGIDLSFPRPSAVLVQKDDVFRNVLTNTESVVASGTVNHAVTYGGKGLKFSNSAITHAKACQGQTFSRIAVIMPTALAAGSGTISNTRTNNAVNGAQWYVNNTGVQGLNKAGITAMGTAASGISDNKISVIGITYDAATVKFYADGRLAGTTSSAQTFTIEDGRFGSRDGTNEPFIGVILLHVDWEGKILPESLMQKLTSNPWQLFAPQQRIFAVGAAAAAGGFNPYWAMGSNQVIQGNGVQA